MCSLNPLIISCWLLFCWTLNKCYCLLSKSLVGLFEFVAPLKLSFSNMHKSCALGSTFLSVVRKLCFWLSLTFRCVSFLGSKLCHLWETIPSLSILSDRQSFVIKRSRIGPEATKVTLLFTKQMSGTLLSENNSLCQDTDFSNKKKPFDRCIDQCSSIQIPSDENAHD